MSDNFKLGVTIALITLIGFALSAGALIDYEFSRIEARLTALEAGR